MLMGHTIVIAIVAYPSTALWEPTGHRKVFAACTKYLSMTCWLQRGRRYPQRPPKSALTVARWSVTFRRLPKTTENFEVAGGR